MGFKVVDLEARNIIKSGSSDSYLLLGGGGTKAVSDFASSGHTHSYLPLSGGTMSNTDVVTNLNADLLDGVHRDSFYCCSNYWGSNSGESNGVGNWSYGEVAGVPASYGSLSVFGRYGVDYFYPQLYVGHKAGRAWLRGADSYGSTFGPWHELAFIDSNVASATNADTVDGYHESSFLRWRSTTSTTGEDTLWNQIGIKHYENALPDALATYFPNAYSWGEVISLCTNNARFDIYANHGSTDWDGIYVRSGWNTDKKQWKRLAFTSDLPTKSSWNYDDRYVSSLGTSGNYLVWTKNGTNNNITVPYSSTSNYSTSSGSASTLDGYGKSYFLSESGVYSGNTLGNKILGVYPSNDLGANTSYGVLLQYGHQAHDAAPGTPERWYTQLLDNHSNGRWQLRRRVNDGSWTAWKTIAWTDEIPSISTLSNSEIDNIIV